MRRIERFVTLAACLGTQAVSAPDVATHDITVGANTEFRLAVSALSGSELRYVLLEAPSGMTIGGSDGLVRWVPGAADTGVHRVVVETCDTFSTCAQDTFTTMVQAKASAPQAVAEEIDGIWISTESDISVSPNPTVPLTNRRGLNAGSLSYMPRATDLVNSSRAGALIRVRVPAPRVRSQLYDVRAAVMDIAGNTVATCREPRILRAYLCPDASVPFTLDFYWDGLNEKGLPAAPGIYRTTVTVASSSGEAGVLRYAGEVGIKR